MKSRVGIIVDMETKKVLYVGVRNISCIVRTRTESMGAEAQKHEYHKTWEGLSLSGKPRVQGKRWIDKHNVQETNKDCKMCYQNEKCGP